MFKRAIPLVALLFVACGDGGDQLDDLCSGINCGNGYCAVSSQGPICICDEGSTKQNGVCMEAPAANPCEGVTCSGHGSCIVTASNEAFCACDQGYRREGTSCVLTTATCSGVNCGQNGFCVITSANQPLCVCNQGYHWDGEQCIADPCSGVDCGENASCIATNDNKALCVCNQGHQWEGDKCVPSTNICAEVDCGEHGRCALGAEGPICVCDHGYTLQDDVCKETSPNNPCKSVYCAGNGVCAVGHDDTPVCLCRPGYYSDGDKCVLYGGEVQPDSVCFGVTCGGYGSCVVTTNNSPLCICDEGYRREGLNCVATDACITSNFCVDGWCLVPACTFYMGSPDDEACRNTNEGPVHSVKITRAFYMKQTEVTQKEWRTLMGNNPSAHSGCDDCPVEKVNWYDAIYYANKLSVREYLDPCYTIGNCTGELGSGPSECEVTFYGLECTGYRLPTEAEWEHATRAGTSTPYFVGGNTGPDGTPVCGSGAPLGIELPSVAWYGYNSNNETHTVAGKLANPLGLYDVHGNVWEWVNDWFTDNHHITCGHYCTDPTGPDDGTKRALRGGGYSTNADRLRSAFRGSDEPNHIADNVGFRLVRSAF